MTVSTESSHVELTYTGVETVFPAGFTAQSATHIFVSYIGSDGSFTTLTQGVNVTVAIDGTTAAVTVNAIAGAMPTLVPGILIIDRVTPGLQATAFANLGGYTATVHQALHDAAALRDDELKYRISRAILVPTSETVTVTWPALATRQGVGGAGTVAGFDGSGNPTVYAVGNNINGLTFGAGGSVGGQNAIFGADGYHLVAGGPPGSIVIQTDATGTINVSATDAYWRLSHAATTINLPFANTRNRLPLRLKDVTGNALASPHTIVPKGTDTIEGVNANWTIGADRGSILLVPNAGGASTGWDIL